MYIVQKSGMIRIYLFINFVKPKLNSKKVNNKDIQISEKR